MTWTWTPWALLLKQNQKKDSLDYRHIPSLQNKKLQNYPDT